HGQGNFPQWHRAGAVPRARRPRRPHGGVVEPIPRLAAALILVALAAGCARTHKAPPTAAPAPTVSPPVARALPPEPRAIQTGKASWYGDAHHGRQTASGEPLDMNALTPAHRTLPLGTPGLGENL